MGSKKMHKMHLLRTNYNGVVPSKRKFRSYCGRVKRTVKALGFDTTDATVCQTCVRAYNAKR